MSADRRVIGSAPVYKDGAYIGSVDIVADDAGPVRADNGGVTRCAACDRWFNARHKDGSLTTVCHWCGAPVHADQPTPHVWDHKPGWMRKHTRNHHVRH